MYVYYNTSSIYVYFMYVYFTYVCMYIACEPASTAPPTIWASFLELSPGCAPTPFAAPRTPQMSRQPA